MRVVTWNLNNRRYNQTAWDQLIGLDPDLALISEANFVPEDFPGFNFYCEPAMGHKRSPRNFRTCILTKGEIGPPIELAARQTWVNEGLSTFPGNIVARKVSFKAWRDVNVVSVHMPSWYFPYKEFTSEDVTDVMLPGYDKISMSELLWAALKETMPCLGGDWIVGGDFNTSEFIGSTKRQNDANCEVIERMKRLGFVEAIRHMCGGPVPSWKSSQRTAILKHQLDHLYLSGAFRIHLKSAYVGDPERYFPMGLSDHLPLIAEIEFPE
ncbi:endonuclease/exonuclease/phosphatase family protein [Sinorhizobium meliloti]|uniref:endonuclease/exonuclease/phosphatase family protein n=1 Tax=Rhizobium meliloti TaxID=382 RepID=UPI0002A59153|nr:endonuclease/exonuclease/phosphatase family protein [Sinorhizobium meliloti]AGA08975.1 Exonuclease III [Sinorhizobium meliloti GR4]